MTDIQQQIDQLRREQLIIDLLLITIRNQHYEGTLPRGEKNDQLELLMKATVESQALGSHIKELIKRRDTR
jgi:hypothetical protein